ncbi:MAG TPA: F0F1 ATP synthase subunit B [Candidatus Binatia bacterium]|nr:F0F1 ATP synthase subunit B [Candidatus Binatia bacterium]
MVAATSSILTPNLTLIAEIIAFLLMVGILWRWVYPRVMRAADHRERIIETGLRQAQESERRLSEVKGQVDQLLEEARGQAREIGSRAHRDAASEAEEVRAKAREEAKAFAEQARQDIVAERDKAMRDLSGQVGALVVAAAAQVLGESIDAAAHQKLIERSVKSLEEHPQ